MRTLLIANRGEIARRIIRTAHELGITTVIPYTDADAGTTFVREADVAVRVPAANPKDAYLDAKALADLACRYGADAVHPGYGFLSESVELASACEAAGLTFVGPSVEAIATMGSKLESKKLAERAGIPVLTSHPLAPGQDVAGIDDLTFPVLVKASAGGGGRGMRVVREAAGLAAAVTEARAEAQASFGDGTVFTERLLERARHVEVQVFGDRFGDVVHLGERDCSVQRRHQKLVEESPCPAIGADLRDRICRAATDLAGEVGYVGAGTVEFLVQDEEFFFLEMNTRLQVEHPVTELVTGLDLVAWQLRVARGEPLPLAQHLIRFDGHAVEVRLVAEDARAGFRPVVGRMHRWSFPDRAPVRVDGWVESGSEVSPHFDSLLAKVIAHGPTRADAVNQLTRALRGMRAHGVTTNRDQLVATVEHTDFRAGRATTGFLDDHPELAAAAPTDEDVARRCVAAALVVARRNRDSAPVLRDAPPAWRNIRAVPRTVVWSPEAGGEIEVAYVPRRDGGFDVTCAGRELPCRVGAGIGDRYPVEIGEAAFEVEVHVHDRRVWVNDRRGQSELRLAGAAAGEAADAGGNGTAPLPGVVVAVLVEPGASVAKGDPLLTLEAMKMQHTVHAAHAGTVRSLHVKAGDTVAAAQPLVDLEAVPE